VIEPRLDDRWQPRRTLQRDKRSHRRSATACRSSRMNTRLQRRPFRNSGKVHGKRLQDLGRCHHARDLDRDAARHRPGTRKPWREDPSGPLDMADRRISSITGARRAVPHDHAEMRARRLDVDGQSQPHTNNIIWAAPATGAGLPATVAPIGRARRSNSRSCWSGRSAASRPRCFRA